MNTRRQGRSYFPQRHFGGSEIEGRSSDFDYASTCKRVGLRKPTFMKACFLGQYPGWVVASAVRDSRRLTTGRGNPWILEASP
jgi:hypothetical protein